MSLIAELRAALPGASVLTAREACVAFECDGLTAHRQIPDIVVLPRSVEQTQAVLRICRRTDPFRLRG
jgi:glycolate oxidase